MGKDYRPSACATPDARATGDGRSTASPLRAPFPWYGGKSRAAHLIWPHMGDTINYVEPFAGSLAVLLNRPFEVRNETVNDLDCYLANFWRALKHDPEGVCEHCDWPVNEADLHSRHGWLLDQADFRERMLTDPDYYDVRIAGWWVWGQCCWIGGGWCSEWVKKRPLIIKGGAGIHGQWIKRPRVANGGRGVTKAHQERPTVMSGGHGVHRTSIELAEYLLALSARLRRVTVCCGDWSRVVTTTCTTLIGVTAVLLDPPYSGDSGRDPQLYSTDDHDVAHLAREWALDHGDDPKLRIALCGYEGEHDMPDSWECVAWEASSINSKTDNHKRERIWFSPHCLKPDGHGPLFEEAVAVE